MKAMSGTPTRSYKQLFLTGAWIPNYEEIEYENYYHRRRPLRPWSRVETERTGSRNMGFI